jgi:hypothetical protein
VQRPLLVTRLLAVAALAAVVGGTVLVGASSGRTRAQGKAPPGGFTVKIPAPGHVELVIVQAKAGTRFAKGAVPKPTLATPSKLPKGILVVADVGRLKKSHGVLVTGVLVVNLNKKVASRRAAATSDFNIATGLKWTPLRYTSPIRASADDCALAGGQIACTGTDPRGLGTLYGWQTTSLDNYIGFFFSSQSGILIALDLGWASHNADDFLGAGQNLQFLPFAPSGNSFIAAPSASGPPGPDPFALFGAINSFVSPPPPTVLCSTFFVNQGTPNEVISTTKCQGGNFTGLLFTPPAGNRIVDQFPEQGQATCNGMSSGAVYCVFPSPVSSSGPIDLRFQGPPNGVQVQRSTNSGQSYEPGSWNSTGP